MGGPGQRLPFAPSTHRPTDPTGRPSPPPLALHRYHAQALKIDNAVNFVDAARTPVVWWLLQFQRHAIVAAGSVTADALATIRAAAFAGSFTVVFRDANAGRPALEVA